MRVGRSDTCNEEKDERDGKRYSGTARRCLIPHHSSIDTSCGLRAAQAICQSGIVDPSRLPHGRESALSTGLVARRVQIRLTVVFAPKIFNADRKSQGTKKQGARKQGESSSTVPQTRRETPEPMQGANANEGLILVD